MCVHVGKFIKVREVRFANVEQQWGLQRHKRTHSALNPARQAGTRFTYLGGMEG